MNRPPDEREQAQSGKDSRRSSLEHDDEVQAQSEELFCPSCGAEVPEGARSCPVCYKGVYRTCFCGCQLPANERICPNCGADWSQSARVARKSRSRTPRTRKLFRYAAVGALVAIAAALVVFGLLTGLAKLAAPEAGGMPTGLAERVALALSGIASLFGRIGAFFVRYGRLMLSILAIVLVGALAGVGVYIWRLKNHGHRNNHTSRTTRRVRRKKRQ